MKEVKIILPETFEEISKMPEGLDKVGANFLLDLNGLLTDMGSFSQGAIRLAFGRLVQELVISISERTKYDVNQKLKNQRENEFLLSSILKKKDPDNFIN